MATPVLREDKPKCFGRIDEPEKNSEGWNPNSPECAGGASPTGKLPQCIFFQSCGSLVQAKKMEAARKLIDPKSLVPTPSFRPPPAITAQQQQQPVPQQPVQAQVVQQQPAQPSFIQRFSEQLAQQQQQQQMQQLAAQQQQQQALWQQQQMRLQQNQPQQMVPYGYQQMMPVNYQMPSYLTVPEPMQPGGFWKMFGVTVFRSMGKSVGHSVAHMFDSVPFGSNPKT